MTDTTRRPADGRGPIPVRVEAWEFRPHVVREDCRLTPSHPLWGQPCPACWGDLGADGEPVALVAVGIAPENRKVEGWTTAGAVAVHAGCAIPTTLGRS